MGNPKGSTKNLVFQGNVVRYAKQIQAEFKLTWTAALAKAKAILAL